MALLPEIADLVTYLFQEIACRKQFAAFALALLPLLAEAAITFTVCRGFLLKRPPAAAIPTSIKSIILINLLLTLLLVCTLLTEGVIVSAKQLPDRCYGDGYNHIGRLPTLVSVAPSETPTSSWSVKEESVQRLEDELKVHKIERGGAAYLDLVALGLVWVVVAVYVGAVARVGLRVAGSAEGESEKRSWSWRASRKIMHVVDRSKWVGLCFALFFSTPVSARLYIYWDYSRKMGPRPAHDNIVAFLLETMKAERVWRWTAASATLILLALVCVYTIAARVALYISCKRISLQHPDDAFICATV